MRSVLLAFSIAVTGPIHAETSTTDWPAVADRDLDFIEATILADHPGPLDPDGEGFRAWLRDGLAQSRHMARSAHDLVSTESSIARFTAGFADPHLGVAFSAVPESLNWPGFIVARRGSKTLVVDRDSKASSVPQIGWELVSCDGHDPDKFMQHEVLPYLDGRVHLQSVQVNLSSFLLVTGFFPERPAFERCMFLDDQRAPRNISLNWTPVPLSELWPRLRVAGFGPPPQLARREISTGRYWASFPSFWPETVDAERELHGAIDGLRELHEADLVVIDVRGNGGGSSEWGYRIAQSLFGDDAAAAASLRAAGDSYAEWRVSRNNQANIQNETLPLLEQQFGRDSAIYKEYEHLAEAMTRALADGKQFIRQEGTDLETFGDNRKNGPRQVVLLTDGRCGSACLNFSDLMLSVPGVMHFGQETSADTFYMETRLVPLPSGLGNLVLSQKVWRHRLRGSNTPLIPSKIFNGDISDTEAVEAWVLDQID